MLIARSVNPALMALLAFVLEILSFLLFENAPQLKYKLTYADLRAVSFISIYFSCFALITIFYSFWGIIFNKNIREEVSDSTAIRRYHWLIAVSYTALIGSLAILYLSLSANYAKYNKEVRSLYPSIFQSRPIAQELYEYFLLTPKPVAIFSINSNANLEILGTYRHPEESKLLAAKIDNFIEALQQKTNCNEIYVRIITTPFGEMVSLEATIRIPDTNYILNQNGTKHLNTAEGLSTLVILPVDLTRKISKILSERYIKTLQINPANRKNALGNATEDSFSSKLARELKKL